MEMIGALFVSGLGGWGRGLAVKSANIRWQGKIASDLAFDDWPSVGRPRSATNYAYDGDLHTLKWLLLDLHVVLRSF